MLVLPSIVSTTQHFPSANKELGKGVRMFGIEVQPAAIFKGGEIFPGRQVAGKVKLTAHIYLIRRRTSGALIPLPCMHSCSALRQLHSYIFNVRKLSVKFI